MDEHIHFAGYRFAPNKAVLVCEHVFCKTSDLRIIVHDFDGWLQCLSGEANPSSEDAKTVALSELKDRLPSSSELPLLKPGQYAVMTEREWTVHKIEDA